MIVKKIEIENYKGFEKQEIIFNDNLNVFIGANASGKTSILEAIVKCLYDLTKEFVPVEDGLLLTDDDINHNKTHCQITTHVNIFEHQLLPINISAGSPSTEMLELKSLYQKEDIFFFQAFSAKLTKGNFTIPIVKYFPSKKIQVNYLPQKPTKVDKIPQLETWSNIFQNAHSYSQLLHWFFDQETQEIRKKMEHEDFSIENSRLKNVRYAIEQALLKMYNKSYTIKSNGRPKEGTNQLIRTLSLQLKGDNSAFQEDLEAKSDGEKAIITLVADIAYNLALAHDFESDENYPNSPGIVLIDEIEQHLHPNWQRKIIPILTSVFPKIQFFITTHSPQVISSVNSEHVFVCQDFTVGKMHLKTKGVDSNSLLKFIFNSTERPKEYIDLVNKFDELIDKDADISELEKIIEKVSKLEEEDSGSDISNLVSELEIQLSAYKFDLEHEMD